MEITLTCHELTWNCGNVNQPDFGKAIITYVPFRRIAETKSMKFYLQGYRYKNAFNEELATRIMLDFIYYVLPEKVKVTLEQTSRGGIFNTCTVFWDGLNEADAKLLKDLKYTPKTNFRGGWPMAK